MIENYRKLKFDPISGKNVATLASVGVNIQQFEFETGSSLWVIEHDMNTTNVICQVFNDSSEYVCYDDINVEENRIEIRFSSNVSGFCNILFI